MGWWQTPIQFLGRGIMSPAKFVEARWMSDTDKALALAISEARGCEVSVTAVTQHRQSRGFAKGYSGTPQIFQDGARPRFTDIPVIKVRSVLVMADVEVPFHDASWCSEVAGWAADQGVEDVILAGDFVHFDALSGWTPAIMGVDGVMPDLHDELVEASRFASRLLSLFKRVYLIMGNHEKRLSASLAGRARVQTGLIRMLLGLEREPHFSISHFYHAVIDDGDAKWRVGHPLNSSMVPVRVAARLADKFGMAYIAGHGHDWGCATSVAGHYAAATGCMCDPEKLEYVALRDNLRPLMQQGAWALLDGQPKLLHPKYGKPTR